MVIHLFLMRPSTLGILCVVVFCGAPFLPPGHCTLPDRLPSAGPANYTVKMLNGRDYMAEHMFRKGVHRHKVVTVLVPREDTGNKTPSGESSSSPDKFGYRLLVYLWLTLIILGSFFILGAASIIAIITAIHQHDQESGPGSKHFFRDDSRQRLLSPLRYLTRRRKRADTLRKMDGTRGHVIGGYRDSGSSSQSMVSLTSRTSSGKFVQRPTSLRPSQEAADQSSQRSMVSLTSVTSGGRHVPSDAPHNPQLKGVPCFGSINQQDELLKSPLSNRGPTDDAGVGGIAPGKTSDHMPISACGISNTDGSGVKLPLIPKSKSQFQGGKVLPPKSRSWWFF